MKNIKLSTRIYLQQILVVASLIGLGVFSIYEMQTITENSRELDEDDLPVLLQNLEVKSGIERMHYESLDLVISATAYVNASSDNDKKSKYESYAADKAAYEKAAEETAAGFSTLEDMVDSLVKIETDSVMLSMFEGFKKDLLVIHEHVMASTANKDSIDVAVKNNDYLAIVLATKKINEAQVVIDEEAEKMSAFSKSDIHRSTKSMKDSAAGITGVLYVIVITVTLVAVVLTVITGFSLSGLRKSVFKISGSVQQVATAAAQSSNAIGLVSDGAKTQTESINQAVTAVEQSVSVLGEVSSSSEKATEIAKISGQAVTVGKDRMQKMVEVVGRIQENSNKVNKITEIISGIANQTNMLALNAAIEAARAGEQGKGFAVVADQVKSLAESSKSSVDEIVELIEKAKADAAEAVKVAEIVSNEMEKIEDGVRKTENMMQSISTAMEEQVSTTEELSHNMDTLREIGTSNANAAEEITETIIELSKISSETNEELKRFNI